MEIADFTAKRLKRWHCTQWSSIVHMSSQVVTYTLETMVQSARRRGWKLQQDLQAVADEDDPGKGLGLGLEQAPTRQKRKTAKGAAASKDLDEMNELLMVAPVAVKPATAPKAAKASSAPRMSPTRVEAEATKKVAKAAPPAAASAITLEVGGPLSCVYTPLSCVYPPC